MRNRALILILLCASLAHVAAKGKPPPKVTPGKVATTEPVATLTEPTSVTIHLKDAAPQAIFAELGRQGQVEFAPADLWTRPMPNVSVDVDGKPFWSAMLDACGKTGLWPLIVGDRKITLSAEKRGWMDGQCIVNGPFLLTANVLARTDQIRVLDPKSVRHSLQLGIAVVPEPKLRVLRGSRFARLTAAADDKGNSMMPEQAANDAPAGGGPLAWTVEAILKYPDAPGAKIAKLAGTARFMVAGGAVPIEVPDIAATKGITRTIAGRELTIRDMTKSGEFYEVRMNISCDGSAADRDAAAQLVHPGDIRLMDERGVGLSLHAWFKIKDNQPKQAPFMFQYSRKLETGSAGEPAKLLWNVPVEVKEMVVPFEFSDLPLP